LGSYRKFICRGVEKGRQEARNRERRNARGTPVASGLDALFSCQRTRRPVGMPGRYVYTTGEAEMEGRGRASGVFAMEAVVNEKAFG